VRHHNARSKGLKLAVVEADAAAGKPYLAVSAIYRWEADYLREWVAFHRLVGVERFFLYDNASDDDHLGALAPFIEDGSVVVHEWPVFPGQPSANLHCIDRHADDARWIAFIDVDEFLFSPSGRPVPEILRGFEEHPAVCVSRAWMGSSGHEQKPEGTVLANFSSRLVLPEPNRAVKCIVDPRQVERRVNEHWFEYKDGALPVDEHGQPLTSWRRDPLTFDVLRLNHYFTKSIEEAMRKFERPQASSGGALRGRLKAPALKERHERHGQPDDVIQRYVPALEQYLAALGERNRSGVSSG
jgi:Glycosyltransferase family 92